MGFLTKSKRQLEWGLAFWIGVGLMSILNVIKLLYTRSAIAYSWIMFGVSILFILVCLILIMTKK